MDPEQLKAAAADFYRRAIAEGASQEQAIRLARRFVATQQAAPAPVNRRPPGGGPTEQPPFATLPPMLGGALDMLVAFGNGASLELAGRLSGDTGAYMDELRGRAPGVTAKTELVGAAATGLAAGGRAGRALGARAAANPYGFRIVQRGTQPVAARAANVAGRILRNRAVQGGGLLGAWEFGKDILGR